MSEYWTAGPARHLTQPLARPAKTRTPVRLRPLLLLPQTPLPFLQHCRVECAAHSGNLGACKRTGHKFQRVRV